MQTTTPRKRARRGQIQRAALVILLCCSGCYSHINSLEGYLPDKEIKLYPTVDELRKSKYTHAAYSYLKDIPVVDGITPSGYAAGTSVWSSIYSFLTGTGWGRKVVFNQDNLYKQGYVGIIHEDIHHLDDLTREGKASWINKEVFLKAYKLLSRDSRFKGIQLWCEERANDWIPNTFGVGYAAEHIAYIGMFLAQDGKEAPDYLKAVFSNILKLKYAEISKYKDISGNIFTIKATPNSIQVLK